ncbi:MAG: GGDEF domain-containing protein [Clostridiales bacterium]|nr:GGDEF domain-containing protein [Clostridiales bacterium]
MIKKQKNWECILIGICLFLFSAFVYRFSRVELDGSNYQELNNGWHVEINDRAYDNVSLDDFLFSSVSKGDVIRMSCELPSEADIENPVLRLYSIHSDIEVQYNDNVYYEYGKELRAENKLLGYGFHFVHIPKDYAGAKLEIIMHITENDAFSSIYAPQICNNDVVFRDFVIQNRLPLAINLFLIIFGVLVTLVSLIFCGRYRKFLRLICVGGFSVGIGCWSLCNYDLIILFTYNLRIKAFLEFGSLYIAPLFVLLFFWGDEFVNRNKIVNIIYRTVVFVQIVFVLTACILQITNVLHFPVLLKIQHLILLVICVGVILLTMHDIIKKQLCNKALILGMTMMLVIGLYDMIHFSIIKYLVVSEDYHYTSVLCVGAMVFVLSQLVEFGAGIGQIFLQGAKAEILEQMAYVDDLTGLANRRRCEEIWDSLDEESADYGIFSFDLNFLKKTNDAKGHAQGDLLIKMCAKVLLKVFDEVGEVGRIGGDEYVVFIRNMEDIDIEKLTQQLKEEIEKTNLENPDLNLSVAYGFCSHEQYPDLDARHIYRKADVFMYEMKAAMKAVRMD